MDDRKFDEFMGNDFGIFKTTVYDKEDEEADAIWEAVDGHMDQRRRVSLLLSNSIIINKLII